MSKKKVKNDKPWEEYAFDFTNNYISNKLNIIGDGNYNLFNQEGWYKENATECAGIHFFKMKKRWSSERLYFSFLLYKYPGKFGFAIKSGGYLGDDKFSDCPVYSYIPDEGEKKLLEKDRNTLKERADFVINLVEGFNDALKKNINVIEEKYFVNREFETEKKE